MGRTGLEEQTEARRKVARSSRRRNWVEKLKKSIDKQLGADCEQVATSLVSQAREGNLSCVRLLVTLSDMETKAKASAKSRGYSQAAAWRNEPEWQGEQSEDSAEARIRGIEPED